GQLLDGELWIEDGPWHRGNLSHILLHPLPAAARLEGRSAAASRARWSGTRKAGILAAMRVRVRVPASSANLGPGFDALALALALYNEVELAASDRVVVRVRGEGEGRLDPGAHNVVARGARMAFEAAGRRFEGAVIDCVNRIPLSRGLGSSAAAWVGGLVGGNVLLGSPLDRNTLLDLAVRAEGHPDNVAAALLGGLTVSCMTDTGVAAVSLPVPAVIEWAVL